ncbi:hypothetical protein BaRGS_00031242 [Batillaria attramentaria]|uniref:Uncharacterized protein n=1 Tax=Batillaria attramentaria TaxID=370345 RepID=A0ABD0JSJ5_9CAEN
MTSAFHTTELYHMSLSLCPKPQSCIICLFPCVQNHRAVSYVSFPVSKTTELYHTSLSVSKTTELYHTLTLPPHPPPQTVRFHPIHHHTLYASTQSTHKLYASTPSTTTNCTLPPHPPPQTVRFHPIHHHTLYASTPLTSSSQNSHPSITHTPRRLARRVVKGKQAGKHSVSCAAALGASDMLDALRHHNTTNPNPGK